MKLDDENSKLEKITRYFSIEERWGFVTREVLHGEIPISRIKHKQMKDANNPMDILVIELENRDEIYLHSEPQGLSGHLEPFEDDKDYRDKLLEINPDYLEEVVRRISPAAGLMIRSALVQKQFA